MRVAISESSVGSSSEVNSPVSFATTENSEGKIKELDKTMGNLDLGGEMDQSYLGQKDFTTQSGGVSSNVHQLCVIITEAAEENDNADNAATHAQGNKSRSISKKEKKKIHVSTGEWRIIMSAINHGTEVPANSRREVLMGYHYALHQHKKKLQEERDEFRRSQENNSVSSGAYWDKYSEVSDSGKERHQEPKHNRRTIARAREENRARSISMQPSDEEEDFVQETPEAALIAAQAYLLTTQPEPGDPQEHMHQAAIKSLGLVEDMLRKHSPEKKLTYYEDKGKKQKVPVLAKPNKRLIRRRKAQGTNGGCKEYYSTNKGEQSTLCMEGRKLRGRRKGDERAMLYPKGSQNASTQRI
jgi:hypothetical protein